MGPLMTDVILIENANLLDLRSGAYRPDTTVVVEGERIREVGQGTSSVGEARRIDARGRTLLPGLIDAHVHAVITRMNLASMAHRPAALVAQE